jgi:hypothetical protein
MDRNGTDHVVRIHLFKDERCGVTGELSGETVPIHEGHYRSAVVRTELSAPQSTVREEIRSPNRLRVPVTK